MSIFKMRVIASNHIQIHFFNIKNKRDRFKVRINITKYKLIGLFNKLVCQEEPESVVSKSEVSLKEESKNN